MHLFENCENSKTQEDIDYKNVFKNVLRRVISIRDIVNEKRPVATNEFNPKLRINEIVYVRSVLTRSKHCIYDGPFKVLKHLGNNDHRNHSSS